MVRVLTALLVAGIGGWVLGRWTGPEREARSRKLARAAGLLLALGSAAWAILGAGQARPVTGPGPARAGLPWEPYSPQRLEELVNQRRVVFLDFTAAWCLTCQVNERATLGDAAVAEEFRETGAALLKADWTNGDAAVTRALQSYGRNGVPLYVVYGPGTGREPKLLPAILTPVLVLKALEAAGSGGERALSVKETTK